MKTLFICSLILVISFRGFCQTVVFDEKHFAIVNQNGAVRNTAEISHHNMLEEVRQNTDNIAINLSSLALVQTMIHRSLTEVNEALKDAIQVKSMALTIQSIYQTSGEIISIASEDPVLLLFAEEYLIQSKTRAVTLVQEVSGFILSEGNNVFINYNVRDELLDKVWLELQVINALMLSVKRSMYWAKMNGVFRSLNPYQNLIDRDLAKVNQIILQLKYIQ